MKHTIIYRISSLGDLDVIASLLFDAGLVYDINSYLKSNNWPYYTLTFNTAEDLILAKIVLKDLKLYEYADADAIRIK